MSKQHVLDIIDTAQGRAAAIDATAPGFAFNKALSVEGYHASIDAARDEVFQYIALQSRLNAQRGRMLAAGRVLAEWSSRMLCAVHSTFGKDSHPYQAAAAVKSSAPRRRPRRRRGAAVAAGSPAAKSMPGRSTARVSEDDADPNAHEVPLGTGRVDVCEKGDAGTEPSADLGDATAAVRRIEVLAQREHRACDAGPADAVEREEEVAGTATVAIDDADAGRALGGALVVPRRCHEASLEDGTDDESDGNAGGPDVVDGAKDGGDPEGGEDGDAYGDGDVQRIGGGAPQGDVGGGDATVGNEEERYRSGRLDLPDGNLEGIGNDGLVALGA